MKWIGYIGAAVILVVGWNAWRGDPYGEAIEYINELEASLGESIGFWEEAYAINEAHSAVFVPKCTGRYAWRKRTNVHIDYVKECNTALHWNNSERERALLRIENLRPERLRALFDIWRLEIDELHQTLERSEFVRAVPTSPLGARNRYRPGGGHGMSRYEMLGVRGTYATKNRNECLEGSRRSKLDHLTYATEHGVTKENYGMVRQFDAHMDCDAAGTWWAKWLVRYL